MNNEFAPVPVKEIAINFLDGKVQVHIMTEDGYWRVFFNHEFPKVLGSLLEGLESVGWLLMKDSSI
jgi:hypothetical protein